MNDCRTFYAETPHVLPDEESSLSLSSDEEVHPPIGLQTNKSQSVVSDRMICAGGYPEGGKGICRVSSNSFLFNRFNDDGAKYTVFYFSHVRWKKYLSNAPSW